MPKIATLPVIVFIIAFASACQDGGGLSHPLVNGEIVQADAVYNDDVSMFKGIEACDTLQDVRDLPKTDPDWKAMDLDQQHDLAQRFNDIHDRLGCTDFGTVDW